MANGAKRKTDEPKIKLVKSEQPEQSESSHVPEDAIDIASLLEPELGDAITEATMLTIPIGKPKDFFRTHPDKSYRPQAMIFVHKVEGVIETQHYIVGPKMRGRMKDEARMCTLVCVVDREGNPRLWPIPLPREGERDNDAWKSARIAAKLGMERWTRVVWVKRSYQARKARPSYAPDPDFSKLPPFNELVRIAFGEHGIINDVNHKVYQDHLASDESKSESDDE